jgi:uncharacterized protein YeaO (DUF488 family)
MIAEGPQADKIGRPRRAMAKTPDIRLKRAYEAPAASDGRRFLVDRLWPRGIQKDALAIEAWVRDAAPSHPLRIRYGHRPQGWQDFAADYEAELDANPETWRPLLEAARAGDPITLVYAARDTERNNAVVLKACLEARAAAEATR